MTDTSCGFVIYAPCMREETVDMLIQELGEGYDVSRRPDGGVEFSLPYDNREQAETFREHAWFVLQCIGRSGPSCFDY